MPDTLDRFKQAQDQPGAGFDAALAELKGGRKRGHWIWYIFPQLAGLGSSALAERYALDGRGEALDYLRDEMLRDRLLTITSAVAEQVLKGLPIRRLMASEIDVLKLVSSMTLFEVVGRELYAATGDETCQSLVHAAEDVLAAAEREGFARCAFTMARLSGS